MKNRRIMKSGEIPPSALVYKTSRISYVENYAIIAFATVVLMMLWPTLNIEFSFSPKTERQFISTMGVFGFVIVVVYLIEEPSIEAFIRKYVVTTHEIIKIEGLLSKKRITIPYQSVANITVYKSIFGRLLNYGTLHVRCFGKEGNDIVMKGIRNPDEVYNIIKNKISLMRQRIIKGGKGKRLTLGRLTEEEME